MLKKIGIIVILGILICGCSKKIEENKAVKPIKITFLKDWAGYGFFFIAEEKGFFRANNVKVELIKQNDSISPVNLYKSGQVDGLGTVIVDIILMNAQGIKTKIVYALDYSDSSDVIIANPKYKQISDLKGKRVSFAGVNTFSHLFVLRAIEMNGLDEKNVLFSNIKENEVLKNLEEGKIDAGHTWPPTSTEAIKKGYEILATGADVKGIIVDFLAFNDDIIKQRPADVQAIVKSIFEAQKFFTENRNEAIDIIANNAAISREDVESTLSGLRIPDLQENLRYLSDKPDKDTIHLMFDFILNFYLNRGQIQKKIEANSIFDNSFLKKIED